MTAPASDACFITASTSALEETLYPSVQLISQLANTVTTLGKPVFEEGFINETQTDLYQDS
ncbi:MAG: hypothetical protein OHK0012_22240 [Synechococcales cyanobacterium]